ncbi:MFS general substrate transporter [Cylindrobasidium torrendii FP15055 ss-10]|uniref:MFS general substrate transporter n=1 Tax=Cylindrobasidium torrendii FP15055 ss-10 TaxID=1314674 RepID=A0A0D7AXG6_9AGAR|nr:MFS general substrate transporter [Cylindrobasidium torrendii FP15055 ss-10]
MFGWTNNPTDGEFKLPKFASRVIILSSNLLLQMSFFIIVSSSNEYANHLGGDSTFSGVVIGIPTVFSGLALIPMQRWDGGKYKFALHLSCGASIVGHILYACAYRAHWLYLILMGRLVSGLAFSMWMYCKRYCSDGRIVGMRQRTTLAGWLVVGQGLGMSAGPFLGGLLTKIGFANAVFNGYTSPSWIMAGVWAAFWVCVWIWFEDVPDEDEDETQTSASTSTSARVSVDAAAPTKGESEAVGNGNVRVVERPSPESDTTADSVDDSMPVVTFGQWGSIVCMCWCAMTCFFILGAWESNIPVFGATPALSFSPFMAGNFIALGGITTLPFLLANLFMARRLQDRHILLVGSSLGLVGLLTFIGLLSTHTISSNGGSVNSGDSLFKKNYASFFMCWWLIALGFNLASTVTVSLLSKQLPQAWNSRTSLFIQYSNYAGRVSGAIWGGSGVAVGMERYVGLQIAIAGIGIALFGGFYRALKTKTG